MLKMISVLCRRSKRTVLAVLHWQFSGTWCVPYAYAALLGAPPPRRPRLCAQPAHPTNPRLCCICVHCQGRLKEHRAGGFIRLVLVQVRACCRGPRDRAPACLGTAIAMPGTMRHWPNSASAAAPAAGLRGRFLPGSEGKTLAGSPSTCTRPLDLIRAPSYSHFIIRCSTSMPDCGDLAGMYHHANMANPAELSNALHASRIRKCCLWQPGTRSRFGAHLF